MEGNESGPKPTRTPLRGLLELTNRLTEALDSDEVARVAVDEARASVGALMAILWIVDDPPTHANLVRTIGVPDDSRQQYARIPLEPWLPMGDAMLRRVPLFFESRAQFTARYPAAEKDAPVREHAPELSYACLPLVAHGRAIGGISLVFPHARDFDADERMSLTVLAHHAAQALERSSLFEREKRTRQRIEGLQQLTAALSSAATVEGVADIATRIGRDAFGFIAASLWVADERGDLSLLSAHGLSKEARAMFARIPLESELPGARVARSRCAMWCESEQDVKSEHASVGALVLRHNAMTAFGALPLVRNDRVLGVLVFSARGPHRFSTEERAFLATIAEHCADALARARLHDDARSTKQLLQKVLERLPVGVVVTRPPDSTLVLSNDAVGRIWRTAGFPISGEERRKMLNVMYPDGRPVPTSESPVVRALHGETVDCVDAKIERQDGSIGWIQTSAAPVLRDDGSVDVAVATIVDMTAVKEARAAADEAARVKDEFLAMLGHELRNPLTPIVTALDLMNLRGGEAFREERTIISHQVRHMGRLVDDLLDISRITRGAVLLQKERVEVADVIANAIEIASPLFERKSQKLTVSVPVCGLPVMVDPGRLAQAVANLLTNAAKYTEPGGSVTISVTRDDGQVCIRVTDTGIGIEPEDLPKVFDVFVQANRSIDRSQGGLGLGLTIVRKLVELNGGSVTAHSDGIGTGSEFVIRLPIESGPDHAQAAHARPLVVEPAGGYRHRVLVVDDNEEVAHVLAAVLETLGCVTHVCHDGPSAIAAAASFDAGLALLDIGLPVMDGYAVARHFRQAAVTAAMRLVAVTGYGQAGDNQRALAAGFDEHIVKPVEIDTLRGVLARVPRRAVRGVV
jgi:signal transduction histidine kinase/ActR/RegA family two-component response regulator/transcriptional regulator with GAF, ATPase, and Fis domain